MTPPSTGQSGASAIANAPFTFSSQLPALGLGGLVDANGEPLAVGDAVVSVAQGTQQAYGGSWWKDCGRWGRGLSMLADQYFDSLKGALLSKSRGRTVHVEGAGSQPDSLLLSLRGEGVPSNLPKFEFGRTLVKKVGI